MKNPFERIRQGALILVSTTVVAICGYRYLSNQSWLESVYWFVITVSSVGYTEDSRVNAEIQAFTIVVIVVGMSATVYTIGGLLQSMLEGEIERALGVRRTTREIQRLKGHIIICGFGRIGETLVDDLAHSAQRLLVIDKQPERLGEAREQQCLVLAGDATEEDVLVSGGVERAAILVSALPSDADNMFITLTSRNLNPTLRIIARGEHPSSEKKLIQAGADRVVMPMVTGAQRIARMIQRPHTADLLEQMVRREATNVGMDELYINDSSPLLGQTVRDAETHRKHRLLVVAVTRAGGETTFNPDADYVFQAGDTLVVMGRQVDIERFSTTYQL